MCAQVLPPKFYEKKVAGEKVAKIYQKRRGQISAQGAGKNPPKAHVQSNIMSISTTKEARAKIRPGRKQISAQDLPLKFYQKRRRQIWAKFLPKKAQANLPSKIYRKRRGQISANI